MKTQMRKKPFQLFLVSGFHTCYIQYVRFKLCLWVHILFAFFWCFSGGGTFPCYLLNFGATIFHLHCSFVFPWCSSISRWLSPIFHCFHGLFIHGVYRFCDGFHRVLHVLVGFSIVYIFLNVLVFIIFLLVFIGFFPSCFRVGLGF